MNYLPSREVLDTLIKKWGSEPSTTCKPRSDHYNRVMRILYGTYPEYNKWLENPYMKKQMEISWEFHTGLYWKSKKSLQLWYGA
jgi:hypothetical protein